MYLSNFIKLHSSDFDLFYFHVLLSVCRESAARKVSGVRQELDCKTSHAVLWFEVID